MSEQPSTWPPPKHKSKAWFFGVAIVLFVFAKFALVFGIIMYSQGLNRVPARWKNFQDLEDVDRSILRYDSVYGDYMEWTGWQDLGDAESLTRRLLIDESGKFATKVIIHDTTGFFTRIPGDIDYSGQWSESNGKLILKFYFPPYTWDDAFDSVRNNKNMVFVDGETIEFNPSADTVWIMGTPCVRKNK